MTRDLHPIKKQKSFISRLLDATTYFYYHYYILLLRRQQLFMNRIADNEVHVRAVHAFDQQLLKNKATTTTVVEERAMSIFLR